MLLRASGEQTGDEYTVAAVTDTTLDAGVDHAELLLQLTDATVQGRWDDLEALRSRGRLELGHQETVDVLTVAAAFNGITRVADATGIPLDETTAATTVVLRASTGIDEFDYDRKSDRYGGSNVGRDTRL